MQENLEYIDNFFRGETRPEEKAAFEKRITEDAAFAEEVAWYVAAMSVLKSEATTARKAAFRELVPTETTTAATPVRKLWPWLAAAAAAAVIVISLVLFNAPARPDQLAANYIQHDLKTLRVTMGSTEDSLQQGLRLYNDGKLQEALTVFRNIMQTDPANHLAKENAGIVSLQLQQYDQALDYFTQLEKDTLYANPGTFYRALTLMKRNGPDDAATAKQLLQQVVDKNLAKKETAEQWLQKNW